MLKRKSSTRWRLFTARTLAATLGVTLVSAELASADDGYQSADGLSVYLGIMPASVVRGHPADHEEGAMHGGAPSGRHPQHLVVAVFDSQSSNRIENAEIVATVSSLGHVSHERIELEPMTIADTITYGGFANFPGRSRYEIELSISIPDRIDRPISHSPAIISNRVGQAARCGTARSGTAESFRERGRKNPGDLYTGYAPCSAAELTLRRRASSAPM